MKVCPRCGRSWPETGRFCPMDGEALIVAPEPPAEARTPEAAAPTGPAPAPRKATRKTRAMPAQPAGDPVDVATSRTSASETPGKKRARGGFSETRWFMAGELEVPKDEIGPEILAPKDLEPRYRKTRELPPEVRRRFSLERGEEESKESK